MFTKWTWSLTGRATQIGYNSAKASKNSKIAFWMSKRKCVISLNHEKEIDEILSIPKNKFEQLGYVHASSILPLLKKLEVYKHSISKANLNVLNKLVYHAVKTDFRPSSSIVQSYWNLVSSCKCFVAASEEQLILYLKMCVDSRKSLSIENTIYYIEENGIEFNQEIAELLLRNCSQFGNQVGASLILSRMKDGSLLINEGVFISLIMVQGKCCNIDGVREIMKTMKGVRIPESLNTDCALIVAFIYCQIWNELRLKVDGIIFSKKTISQEQYMDILASFVESGNFQKFTSILDYIIDSRIGLAGNVDIKKLLLKFIHQNYATEAVYILCKLMDNQKGDKHFDFIRELVRAKLESGSVITLCEKMEESGLEDRALSFALKTALKEHQELAWDILRTMKAKDLPIREHYFWPLFIYDVPSDDIIANALRVVRGMVDLGFVPRSETLVDYILPKLELENVDVALQSLTKSGVDRSEAFTPLLQVLLKKKLVDQVEHLLTRSCRSLCVDLSSLTNVMCQLYVSHPQRCISLLSLFTSHQVPFDNEAVLFPGKFLKRMFFKNSINSDYTKAAELIESMSSANLKITADHKYWILKKSSEHIAVEIESSLTSLVDPSIEVHYQKSSDVIPHPNEMSLSALENHLIELKAKKMNVRGVLRRLLIRYAHDGCQQKVKDIVEELRECNAEEAPPLSTGMQSSILSNYIAENDLEAALESYFILASKQDFTVDTYKVIDLCSLLVKEKNINEATNLLRDYTRNCPSTYRHDKEGIARNCHKLLQCCSKYSNHSSTKSIFELLISENLLDPCKKSLGPIIKCKLLRGDLPGSVEEAENLYSKYGIVSMRVEILVNLLKSLLEAKKMNEKSFEIDVLNSLVDRMDALCTAAFNRNVAKADVLSASLQVENTQDSIRIFQSVEPWLRDWHVRNMCKYFAQKEFLGPLKLLLLVSRHSERVDRVFIYNCIITICSKRGNKSEALSLWKSVEEEEIFSYELKTKLFQLLVDVGVEIPLEST